MRKKQGHDAEEKIATAREIIGKSLIRNGIRFKFHPRSPWCYSGSHTGKSKLSLTSFTSDRHGFG